MRFGLSMAAAGLAARQARIDAATLPDLLQIANRDKLRVAPLSHREWLKRQELRTRCLTASWSGRRPGFRKQYPSALSR